MPVISVQDLHKRYGDRHAVDGVDLHVDAGEVFGILGPNGAGKTTTVECLTGLRRRDSGRVQVLGLDPEADRAALAPLIGVSLQTSTLPDRIRVGEAVELFRSFYPDPADTGELLERLGLASVRRQKWSTLSGGQQQRLAVALALVGRPRVAVLDELTTGLDPQARREVWDLVRAERDRGVTVVLVTHFMEEAQALCDRVALIDAGRVTAIGSPGELVDSLAAAQQLRLRVADPFDRALLADLPEVSRVEVVPSDGGSLVTVDGTGDVVLAVTYRLAQLGIAARDLRVHQSTLDDAYVTLTAPQGARS